MADNIGKQANGMDDSPRGRLLAAAAHLFRTRGFERTTVRDLAQEVGIQSGSIFHHFKTKEEILRCVMEEVIHFNTDRMKLALQQAKNPREKLRALILCELVSINGATGEAMAVLIYEWRSLKPESQRYILTLREQYEQLWLNALDEAKRAGLVQAHVDTFILRRFLTGALSWSNYWYKPEGALSLEQMADQALALIVKN